MTNPNTITLTLRQDQIEKLYEAWKEFASPKTPPYSLYQLRPENCVITVYTSKKAVFQGKDASVYASPFMESEICDEPVKKKTTGSKETNRFPQAGSDEVGTGDYFGPVCVCACIVKEEDLPLLKQYEVQDSKQLTDEKIRKIAPQLMKSLTHSLLVLLPSKYNKVHDRYNMNAIKSMLHNQAYLNLAKKETVPEFKIIDQFTPESLYYRYLRYEENVVHGIHFETKAENKYPSVAAASIIARYAFLDAMDKFEKEYDMKLAKGAGAEVDQCAQTFVDRYGYDRLQEIAKLHFANTSKLKNFI